MDRLSANGSNAPNSSKKRKAAELEEQENALPSKSKPGKKRATKSKAKPSSTPVDAVPFRIECPLKRRIEKGDRFFGSETVAEDLTFDYAVLPGDRWKNMRSYKNVKYAEHTFTIGTIVYINNSENPPDPPPAEASEEDVLTYDRKHFWVGKIADTRAANEKAVYLRVIWLYWPEELPMGRQSYHSDHELVLSNAMDIVDATTISWTAEVAHWDESNVDIPIGNRFWRQTFDVGRLGAAKKGGLSRLKRHCVCKQPHNPDRVMFQCKDTSCGTWNHDECLIRDVTTRAESLYRTSNDRQDSARKAEESSQILSPITDLGKYVQDKLMPAMDAVTEQALPHLTNGVTEAAKSHSRKKGHSLKNGSSRSGGTDISGHYKVEILGSEDTDAPLTARVQVSTDRAAVQEDAQDTGTNSRTWDLPVNCLVCGKAMD